MIRITSVPTDEIRSDFGIDLGRYRCGKSRLTRRECQILALLNKHFDLMVTWERLIDVLYWDDLEGGPDNPKNVVSVALCTLRRKMLDTGYQIVTIPNEGIMLTYRQYVECQRKTGT